jgi:hypothetical protein
MIVQDKQIKRPQRSVEWDRFPLSKFSPLPEGL